MQLIWHPGLNLKEVEKQAIIAAYKHFYSNKAATADCLGICSKTLTDKLVSYGIEKPEDAGVNEKRKNRKLKDEDKAS